MDGLRIRDRYHVVRGKDVKCGNCGFCCTSYSKVDLHVTDIFRIAEHLGIGPKAFFDGYCKVIKGDDDSSTFALDVEGGCKFRSGGGCTIYEARPDMCAFYPYSYTCLNASQTQKKEMKINPSCSVHALDDDLIILPDIERMIDSRIFYMVKEMYLARCDGAFNEEVAKAFHQSGLAQVRNARMRGIIRKQIMSELIKSVPVDEKTREPLLSTDDVVAICKNMGES